MPAFYALLLVLAIGQHWRWISVPKADLAAAALFVTNYAPLHTPEWIGHAWSLCVEEQFYLLWPVLLAILARWGRPAQRRAAIALILLVPAVRIASWVLLPHDHLLVRRMPVLTHARLDTLMFGCLAALLYPSARFQGVLRRVFDSRLHYGAFAFLFLVSPYLTTWLGERYLVLGGYSLEGVCIALLLLWAVQHPLGRAGRLLNSWPVVHIGLISYSLYLWQQLFLVGAEPHLDRRVPAEHPARLRGRRGVLLADRTPRPPRPRPPDRPAKVSNPRRPPRRRRNAAAAAVRIERQDARTPR